MRNSIIAVLLFICIAACTQKSYEVKMIDGVKTAVNPEMPITQFSLKTELEIPGESPDYAITDIRDIEVDKDNNIYFLDMSQSKIFKFDETGKFLRTISQKGEGPGELHKPAYMYYTPHNTLLIQDISLTILNEFDAEGNYLSRKKIEIVRPVQILRNPDNTYLVSGILLKHSVNRNYLLHRFNSEFELIDSFFEIENLDTPYSFVEYNGRIVINNTIDNDITVLKDKIPVLHIKRKLYFKGGIEKDDYCTFVNSTSNCLNMDSEGNIYLITYVQDTMRKINESEPVSVLQVFNPEGKQIANMALPGYITEIKIRNNKIYGYGCDDNTLRKYGSFITDSGTGENYD